MLEKDHELKERQIGSTEEFLENKENDGNIKNDVKKGSQKVKKEKTNVVNGSVSSSVVDEGHANSENKCDIRKEPHWEPISIADFEVQGVKNLIERLRTWDRAIKNCPPEIADQEALLDRLEVIFILFPCMYFRFCLP